nr:TonB-dependent receptor [uncultured Draconibacterium sp.]
MIYKKHVLAVVILFLSQLVWAQSKLDSLQHIKEVKVTANLTAKEVIPVQQLSGDDLKKLSVHSVADAIRYFSGVQIKDYGGIGGLKTVNIRSMGSQHVGVFYDGIELGNAQNGVVDLGKFSLDNMEAVSLYNGQKSAIFQPAKDFGSAGSIYMTTRTPKFLKNRKYNLKASVKTGSFNLVNPSVLWEYKFNKKLSSSFNAEYMYTSGKYKFSYTKKNGYDTTAVRQNGDVNAVRLEYGLFGKVSQGEWKAKAYFYNSECGYPGAFVREEPGRFKNEDRQWDTNFFLQSSFKKNYRKYSFLLSGKYAYDYLHYLSDPRLDVSTMYINNHYRQQEIYLSVANRYFILPFWAVNISTDFQWNKLNADLYGFVYPNRYTGLVAVATGLHFEQFKLQASLLGTFTHETTKTANSAAPNKDKYTPTLIASYQPWQTTDLNFRAFYKRIFRMPTLNDLYYTFIGNKNLDPEYTNQYNIGLTYSQNFKDRVFNRFEIQVDAYYNEVENKIVAMPTSNQFRWTMVNLGLVEIRGVDVALQNSFLFREEIKLNTRINYTYQKAQDFTSKTSNYYGGQIPYIPWHSGSLVLNSSYRNWELNYSFIYTGERYESQANISENYARPWYTSDFSASRKLSWSSKEIRLTAEVNNIFNQQYEVVQNYPMPGINLKFILNITI